MAVPALGYWRFHLNGVVAFWWAYIATRPPGASIADWLSKPTKTGGLDYGDGRCLHGERQLLCNMHGALFEVDTGYCVDGPCSGDSLTRLPIEIDPAGRVVCR